MKQTLVATLLIGLLPALSWGDTITMLKSDSWLTGDQSFASGTNWSNRLPPSEDNDYVIGKSQTLYARNNTDPAGAVTFAGNSLTLDPYGAIYLWLNATDWAQRPYVFNDLIMGKMTTLRAENTTQYGFVIQGSITVNSQLKYPAMCALSSTAGCTIRLDCTLTGEETAELRGISRFGILTDASGNVLSGTGYVDIVGDASEYYGYVTAYSNVTIRVGGEVGLPNGLVQLKQGNSGLQALAWNDAPAPEVAEVDVQDADAALVYSSDVQLKVYSLTLCDQARIDASQIANKIGDSSGIYVDTVYSQAGTVRVDMRNAVIPATIKEFPLLTLGDECEGILDEGTFQVVNANGNVSLQLKGNTLYVENDDSFDPTGYVTLTKDDPFGQGANPTNLYSFFFEGGWSDGLWPTSDKDYLVPAGLRFNFINRGEHAGVRDVMRGLKDTYYWTKIEFLGKSLSIMGTAVNNSPSTSYGYNMNVADMRFLRGGSLLCTFSEGYATTLSQNPTYFNYKMPNNKVTVYSTRSNPFTLMTGDKSSAIIFYSKLLGEEGTAMLLCGSSAYGARLEGDANYTRCVRPIEFAGDNSGYYGSLLVGTNSILHVSSSFVNATVRLLDASYSHLELAGAKDAVLKLGSLVTPAAMSIAIPSTNSLSMSSSSFGGDVNFVCEGYVNGQVNVGKRLTTAKILVNGVEASVLPNGAVVTSAVPGSGTKDDPYVIDSAASLLLFFGGDATTIIKSGAYYQINGLVPTPAEGMTELLRVPNNTVIDLSKFMLGPDIPFDSLSIGVKEAGEYAIIGLQTKILPDRPSEAYTDWNAFMSRDDIYYMTISDSTGTNPETKTRYTSYNGNYGSWRIGMYDAAVTNSTSPVAGYPHAVYPLLYSVRGYGAQMGILAGDQGKFAGDSLTLCNLCGIRADYNGSVIDVADLRVQGNSYVLNCGYTGGEFTIKGAMTVWSEGDEAFSFRTQATNGWTYTVNLEANLIGYKTRTLTAYPNNATFPLGAVKVVLKGDNSQYYGTVLASTNNILVVNSEGGLPNGTIDVSAQAYRVEITGADTAPVPVKNLKMAAGKTLKIGKKGVEVTGAYTAPTSMTLDLSDLKLAEGDNTVLIAPSGTDLSKTTYNVTGLKQGTFRVVGSSLVVTVGELKKQGTMILLK